MSTTTATQGIAKRQKVAHDALFPSQYVPTPVIGTILEFLDVASLVRAAACNASWRTEVFGDCHPQLWNRIEFAPWERRTELNAEVLNDAAAANLTDLK